MPISTNAPFNEFGFSMVQRDLEQLYLALGGIGTGSPGDGQTQDQQVVASQESGDSGGLPDLSGLATTEYVDEAIAGIPSVTLYNLWAYGSVTPSAGYNTFASTSSEGNLAGYISAGVFTAPKRGVYTISSRFELTYDGTATPQFVALITLSNISAALKSTANQFIPPNISFTVGGVSPVYASSTYYPDTNAVWTGIMNAGDTATITNYCSSVTGVTNAFNSLSISGVCP